MQVINTWPDHGLPEAVNQAVLNHLIEPFKSETEAKIYWQQHQTQLIILDSTDTLPSCPEYTDPLPNGYAISLVITSDAGEGVYYLTPPTQE